MERKTIIFLNGSYPSSREFYVLNAHNSFVICADGAYNTIVELGISPDVIIGDHDSIEKEIEGSAEIIAFPTNKDKTDGELALDYAISTNPDKVIILGALGGRIDQELANIFLLGKYPSHNIEILEESMKIWVAKNNDCFSAHEGKTISLLALSDQVTGITTQGLEYRLDNESLYRNSSRGISNVVKSSKVCISYETGELLIILENKFQ